MDNPPCDPSAVDLRLQRLLAHPPWTSRVVVRGQLPPTGPRVAVVGTRHPTAEQRDRAAAMGRGLARLGAVVCSGGAVGIDVAALRGALAAGGRVIAVLPCHPDVPYPPEHAEVYAAIVAHGGALLCLDEREVRTCWFLRRNRLLADVAHGLIAVAANLRSGTMMVARQAVKAGDVLAVAAWPAGMARSDGTAWLAQLGVPAIANDQDLAQWYHGWAVASQDPRITEQPPALRLALDHADLRKAPRARPRGVASTVDVDRPGSPSYAAPGGAAAIGSPPQNPADLLDWPPAHQTVWHAIAHSQPHGLPLEGVVAALGGDRRAANAAVLALSVAGHLALGDNGAWHCCMRPARATEPAAT